MSALQTMEAVQTTATTTLAPTAVPVGNTLTWTQTGGTAPADQGSHRMIPQSLVMVREVGPVYQVLLCYVPHGCCRGARDRRYKLHSSIFLIYFRHWWVCCWQWRLWPWLHQHTRQPHMSVRCRIWTAWLPEVLAWVRGQRLVLTCICTGEV